MKRVVCINHLVFCFVAFLCSNTEFIIAQDRIQGSSLSNIVINNYKSHSLSEPYACNVYYFEKSVIGSELAAFTDAKGVLFSLGNNYNIELGSLVFIPENMRKGARSAQWNHFVEIFDESLKRDEALYEGRSDIAPAAGSLLNAFRRIQVRGPLNPENYRQFNWKTFNLSDEVSALEVTTKRRKGALFEGIIFFNNNTLSVDSIHFHDTGWYSGLHNKLIQGWIRVEFYQTTEGFSIPFQLTGGFVKDEINHTTGIILLDDIINENLADDHAFSDYIAYSKYPVVNYHPEEWSDFAVIKEKFKGIYPGFFPNTQQLINDFENANGMLYRDSKWRGFSAKDRYSDIYRRMEEKFKAGLINKK